MTISFDRDALIADLAATGRGERAALESVYRRTSAKLFGICLRILNDHEEAEDVLQDVYVTIWHKAGSFQPDRASPITWLATIARNRAIDRRRSRPAGTSPLDDDAADSLADGAPSALALLETVDDGRQLRRCLDGLEPESRSAVIEAFMGGRTYEDLARARAVPLGTFKSRIRRALMRLRECLAP